MEKLTEFFGEPISVYTDKDAIEDGILVAINPKDRVTRPVWDWLESTVDMKNPKPPSCWPVDLFGYFGAKKPADRVLAMCRGIVDVNRKRAVPDDGILTAYVACQNGKPIAVNFEGGAKKLWFIPNENGGLTLMFPEDY